MFSRRLQTPDYQVAGLKSIYIKSCIADTTLLKKKQFRPAGISINQYALASIKQQTLVVINLGTFNREV